MTETFGTRLKASRESSAMTQEQAANLLHVPRELLSMWENDARTPSSIQLQEVSNLYNVNGGYLLGNEPLADNSDWDELIGGHTSRAASCFRQWLGFLDRWAEFRREHDGEECLIGSRKPPKDLDQGYLTDARKAPKLAVLARETYRLGADALPDLHAFLDEQNIPVFRVKLGSIEDSKVSGAFLNHQELGWCILVNTSTSIGRQAFTLAHEFAHALFHYSQRRLISRKDVDDPEDKSRERFANAWAAHFLVPGSALRQQLQNICGDGTTVRSEFEVFQLAHYFRVSFSTLVYRLLGERLISEDKKEELLEVNVKEIATQLGLPADGYEVPESSETDWDLKRYPISVRVRVRQAIEDDKLSVSQAAELLDVDTNTVQDELLIQPSTDPEGLNKKEFAELPPL
jgi:Zn-dependent peptidase ImmA (M78 family)/DNA-binding XRE family transcriptional regulator